MSDWFYKQGERVLGPVTRAELDFLANTGRITAATPVRVDSADKWTIYAGGERRANVNRKKASVGSIDSASKTETVSKPEDVSVVVATEDVILSESAGDVAHSREAPDQRTRNATIGAAATLMLTLLMLILFRDQIPTGADTDSAGQGVTASSLQGLTSDSEQATDSVSDNFDKPAVDTTAATTAAQPAAAANDQNAPITSVATGGSGLGNNPASQSAANSADSSTTDSQAPPQQLRESDIGQPLASNAVGDSRSRFTIEAPGEAKFFGLSASGRRFSFVVDRSSSMAGTPLLRAKEELMKCIRSLPRHVEVQVVFFDSFAAAAPGGFKLLSHRRIDELQKWVDLIAPGGGTNVDAGMKMVLSGGQKPDAVFLLTDGEFDAGSPAFIRQLNKSQSVQINTVALVSDAGAPLLKQIARENNGDYRFVP